MKDSTAPKIVIIGCGNVAWHLAKKFREMRCKVLVYNHRVNLALEDFKRELKTEVKVGLHAIDSDASFYFICVPDRFISDCAAKVKPKSPRAVVAHTSGSARLSELGKRGHGTAVFYPLQTFSRNDVINWDEVPIFCEADTDESGEQVAKLAALFSGTVVRCNYEERLAAHLAAVLVNNFTNALYIEAWRLLAPFPALKFELLEPLISKTSGKLRSMDPRLAQTGPAKRGDKKVIRKHLRQIGDNERLRKIYRQMTALIQEQQTS